MTEKKDEMQVDEPKLADEPDAEPTAEAEGGGKEPRKVQTVTHVEMTGLTLLSPRQRPSNNSGGVPAAPTLALPLPALRPEEPAASLRAALSDIVGFAHVTRYRLAVEGIDGGTRDGFVSNDVPANGKTNGAHHPPGGKNGQSRRGRRKKSNGSQSSKDDHLGVVSPYTGRGAAIEPALSRDAEGPDHVLTGRDADGNKLARQGHQRRCQDGRERGEGEGRDGPPVARRVLRPRLPRGPAPFRPVHGRGHAGPLRARGQSRRAAAAGHRRRVVVRDTGRAGAEVAEAKAAARKGFEKEGGEEKKEAEETNGASRPAPAEPQSAAPPKSDDEAKKEKEAEEAKKREDEAARLCEKLSRGGTEGRAHTTINFIQRFIRGFSSTITLIRDALQVRWFRDDLERPRQAPSIHAPPFPRRQDACPARYHQEARALKRDEVPSIPSGVLGPPRRALSIRGLR
ncbi:hypothetical protein THAOC_34666, partial [Thalassiosira oceanica]